MEKLQTSEVRKLKDGHFYIGNRERFCAPKGEVVITEVENNPLWGKRYKIEGYEEWFEENCFE
ncbi:MAG: hypothetical protein WC365_09965 [Candidatus Babeliales bacterium]|jgi:hypothetical protein